MEGGPINRRSGLRVERGGDGIGYRRWCRRQEVEHGSAQQDFCLWSRFRGDDRVQHRFGHVDSSRRFYRLGKRWVDGDWGSRVERK